ncbi:hypothetical protein TNCV_3242151 [Trichonephila clavipes]|nr:hypothetical protein TNCV_3242151 [Trichonephila clavipes]
MSKIWLLEHSVQFGVAFSASDTIFQNPFENTSLDLSFKSIQNPFLLHCLIPGFRRVSYLPQTTSAAVLFSSLVQSDNGTTMLNGLLHSNDYEERRVIRCIDVLQTTPYSAFDTSAVAKSWKEKLQKNLYVSSFKTFYHFKLK